MTWRDRALIFMASVTLTPLAYAFTTSYLWLWFIVPLGLPPIGLAWSYGLVLTGRAFTHVPNFRRPEEKDRLPWPQRVAVATLLPLTLLGVGWVAHWFMGA